MALRDEKEYASIPEFIETNAIKVIFIVKNKNFKNMELK